MALDSKSKIPLEIYSLIIGHIDDKTDLLSMLVSSKAIVADVERKLYSSVQFGQEDNQRHILFLKSVLDPNRGHLSGFVYHYCYIISSKPPRPTVLSLLKRALITFTNLQQIRFGITEEDIFASFLALENPPFQLEFFQWVGPPIARVRPDGVLRFLTSQHALKTLYIHNGGLNSPQIPPLQNLQTLENIVGSVPNILSLLPHTAISIKRIHWTPYFIDNIDHFPPLPDLRILSFTTDFGRPPLSVIAERFGTLKALGLKSLKVC